jgi:hypothetical protein
MNELAVVDKGADWHRLKSLCRPGSKSRTADTNDQRFSAILIQTSWAFNRGLLYLNCGQHGARNSSAI